MNWKLNEFKKLKSTDVVDALKKENFLSNPNEIKSWDSTYEFLNKKINSITKSAVVSMEYKIPYSAARIDVILFYKAKESFKFNIIEMKQWEASDIVGIEDDVYPKVFFRSERDRRFHPAVQLLSYGHTLKSLCDDFKNKIKIEYSLIMPNYNFSKDRYLFTENLKEYNKRIDRYNDIDTLINKINNDGEQFDEDDLVKLIDNLNYKNIDQDIIKNVFNDLNFNLINDEILVAKKALKRLSEGKHVVISGTPGSGKTAVALFIANELLKQNKVISYGSASEIKNCFNSNAVGIKRCEGIFQVFGNCVANPQDGTIVILDESHRMMKSQVDTLCDYQLKKNGKKFQTLWLIDGGQSFRKGEDNSLEYILSKLPKDNTEVLLLKESQFRCGGDTSYPLLCEDLLNNKQTLYKNKNVIIADTIDKALDIFNSFPKGSKGKIASDSWKAGNIDIENYHFKTVQDFGVWSKDDIEEVASAYKAQGAQKDYILFLWGNEFVYRAGEGFRINPENVKDRAWKYYAENYGALTKNQKEYMLMKFKHLYYILLTRFNKKMVIYSIDKETREYLAKYFPSNN